ncbi:peptidoglycan-binding domain-containing protein [Falsirhodobacter sp. 20TX0035]|uniref:peptidoglycan-binding domain-containing protein n=1 Tax=Falsirhodobacter sp. 20TX0035 TaxID=3022019 RepID=UPI00232E5A2C|nr:hypothetical protein [Falsirhodobacter sp. 20TX0035]MDB6454763.1 hypothetical protein [Falsirhodobacter sp. 20TX0035]
MKIWAATLLVLVCASGAAAQNAAAPQPPAPEAAPTGTPRNLLVSPPNSGDIAWGEADVPSARFPGPWQTGSFETYRFRRFSDATASLGADRQMTEWRIDIACLPTTGVCTYASQGTPDGGGMAAAERLGDWLVSLPPPPPVPEPEPPAPPATPPAAIPSVQATAEPDVAPQPDAPQPDAPDTVEDPLDLPPAVSGPSLLPETEGTPVTADAAPVAPPLPPRTPSAPTADAAPAPPQPLPPRSLTPSTPPALPTTRTAAVPAPTSAAPAPPAAAPTVIDVCGRLEGLEGDTPMERLQRLLAEEGFDPGAPDGQAGPRTVAAARAALDAPVDVAALAQAVELVDRLLCID